MSSCTCSRTWTPVRPAPAASCTPVHPRSESTRAERAASRASNSLRCGFGERHMRRYLLLALAAAGALVLGSCQQTLDGSGTPAKERRIVGDFNRISLSIPGSVEIVQGDSTGVVIEGDDNIVPAIETAVRRGTLHIGKVGELGAVALRPETPLRIRVDVRGLSVVELVGSCDVVVPTLDADRVSVNVSGSGEVFIRELTALEVSVSLAGSGNATLGGRAIRQEVTVSGTGSYDGRPLETKQAVVTVSGSGNALVNASGALEAIVSGSGSVGYLGDPVVEERVTGSGEVGPLRRLSDS
ncbi:MAG: hypothetical protein GF405_03985 [Candidatus Eisenbacteria bacterium]|nr:hypothetical protein [Candidatus Eisenbacteria bacterium]